MSYNRSGKAVAYGSITLDDLRQLVMDAADAPGDTKVDVYKDEGDRYWESSYASITVEW